ncbi:TPA: 50S ribosomal protein L30 [Candidatus Marinimicrobia bacterium]|jgi:large subunit ribosomal protein L30|uniref:50S ribosomal protein L30 n=1 Tax=Fidelibacter multiformis TaxID=3377529 RepID=UPI000747D48F|nr:MAG: 50S ribosomal protein L30 [Marinimicrobia bacterium 46_47]KUK91855.1 MAG: LSU ribosomal protein L30P [Marinimicrobia bacterium 46_43]HAE88106.1 50S ribosomal protein L30 [Candidatus Neomarinimicrobiota bacterium]HBY18242.1 50S ribosomal protein L30 [Candidatus Neomarinimicrobiota bacterium]
MAKKKEKKLKVTQIKSTIGYRERTARTIEAMGLGKLHKTVLLPDNGPTRGMISQVSHLVEVEEVEES